MAWFWDHRGLDSNFSVFTLYYVSRASYFPCVSFTHFIYKMGPQSSLSRVLMRMKWEGRCVPFTMDCKGMARHGYFSAWVKVKEWGDPHVPGQIQKLCEFTEAKLEDSKFLIMEKSQQCHLHCWCIPLKLVPFLVKKSVIESLDHSILKRFLDSFPALPTLQLLRKDRLYGNYLLLGTWPALQTKKQWTLGQTMKKEEWLIRSCKWHMFLILLEYRT